MITDVRVTGHGQAAANALAEVVATAKAGRPLVPVTVIVPSNLAGLAARRRLGGTGQGVANVAFVTPFRLAEMLAADQLADSRPLTNPVLGAAVRRALAEADGPLATVAGHSATEQAFAALYGELAHVSEPTLRAVERVGGNAALAVRVYRRVADLLTGFAGEEKVAQAAARRPDLADRLRSVGHIVWHVPEPTTPALAQLLGQVLSVAPASVVVALTGFPEPDAPVLRLCAQVGVTLPPVVLEPPGVLEPPVAAAIVSVTDADEEVRAVVRQIAALADAGTPLDRIGVFHPTPDPYVRTLAQQLAAAGIPANGPSRERLADTVTGRTLLAALALPSERWRRDRVMALVSGAPLRHRDQRVSPAVWEELSRTAGVVQDLSDWEAKLASLSDVIGLRIAAAGPGDEALVQRQRRSLSDVEALAWWVGDLVAAVEDVSTAAGWAAKADAARRLIHQVLGREGRRHAWPEREQEAAAQVDAALSRLATLDDLEPGPSTDVFRRALQAELEVARGRSGRYGEGVMYGPLGAAVGADLDAVFILGLAEGQCPAPRADDPLLPDAVRAVAGDELAGSGARLIDQHRQFVAALASAPPERRVLTYPRGDLRGGRHRLPSRWLLGSASALAGRPVYSTDFPKLAAPVVTVVPSHGAGVGGAADPEAAPASALDRALLVVRAHVAAGGDPADHPAVANLERAFRCVAGRRSEALTEWDGNLSGLPVPSPANGQWLSATGLQDWAACGFRYLLGHVFRLRGRDDPERIVEIGALERGSALHRILERFFSEAVVPGPGTPWSAADRGQLADIADEVFADLEAAGRTGRPLLWRLERQRLSAVLEQFLAFDDQHRLSTRSRPLRLELPFGSKGEPPVEVSLPDGRVILFTGSADRVDQDENGRCYVSDYKSGKGKEYAGLADDPVAGGTALQLGLYSEAALQILGATSAAAHYWMVDDEAGFARHGYEWDGPRRSRFVEVVGAIADGIEAGSFPAVPGGWNTWLLKHENCKRCAFDEICPRDRGDFALAKAGAPELKWREPLGGPADEDEP